MGAIGDKLKSSKKKMFGRKSRDGSATPTSEPATPTGSSGSGDIGGGGGVTPGKPILAAAAPPKKPHGGGPPDMSKVSGVDAQPKPAKGGDAAPRPSQSQREGVTKGENTAMAGDPSQAAKDAVNEKRLPPDGVVAESNLPPTPDDHLIPASTVLLVGDQSACGWHTFDQCCSDLILMATHY